MPEFAVLPPSALQPRWGCAAGCFGECRHLSACRKAEAAFILPLLQNVIFLEAVQDWALPCTPSLSPFLGWLVTELTYAGNVSL